MTPFSSSFSPSFASFLFLAGQSASCTMQPSTMEETEAKGISLFSLSQVLEGNEGGNGTLFPLSELVTPGGASFGKYGSK